MSKLLVAPTLVGLLLAGCSGSSNSPSLPPPAPVAKADSAESDNGASVLVDVLANDETGGGTLSIANVGSPAHGSARIVGARIEYTPAAGFFGSDRFTYRVTSSAGGSASAEVTVSSAVAVQASGRVVLLRDEPVTIRLAGGAAPVEQTLSAGTAEYSLRLRSEQPERALLLEAVGPEAPGLPLAQHYVSLLPSLNELHARAACAGPACAVDVSSEPRLALGSLPTAEYGLFRELAAEDALLEPGTRAALRGYIPAPSLLRHAVLVERGVLGNQRPDQDYVANDSLALVLSRSDLARVAAPQGGQGSGSVANETLLGEAQRTLAFDSPWSDSAAQAEARRLQGALTWLEADTPNRRFALSRWSEGLLRSHGWTETQTGTEEDNYVFRRIERPVTASVEQGLLVLRPVQPGAFLAQRAECFGDGCAVRTVTSLAFGGFLGDYAVQIERGPLLGFGEDAPLREAEVALVAPVGFGEAPLQGSFYTALATTPVNSDADLSRYFSEVLRLSEDGVFAMDDRARLAFSARTRQGQWRLSADGLTLELDDVSGVRERLQLVARGAGRSIGVLETTEADGSRRVAAVEWLPITAPEPILTATPRLCVPAADGWEPAARAPALIPNGERFQLRADGSAVRFVGTQPPEQPSVYDRFDWAVLDGQVNFSLAESALGRPGIRWFGVAVSGDKVLLHVVSTDPDPDMANRYLPRFQQFGASRQIRCEAL
jgi:hypothetical protein